MNQKQKKLGNLTFIQHYIVIVVRKRLKNTHNTHMMRKKPLLSYIG